jgi:hypothetical protein
MYPGATTRATEETLVSAATISPKSDLVLLTGTTSIATINPPFAGFSGLLVLIPTGGAVSLLASGNIAATATLTNLVSKVLCYSKKNNKWYSA